MKLERYVRILLAAVFVGQQDVIGDGFATPSTDFTLQKETADGVVDTQNVNVSVFKTVMVNRERVAQLLGLNPSSPSFQQRYEKRISALTNDQAQAILTICQVRPMLVPLPIPDHLAYGSPVNASIVAITRSCYQTDGETLSAFGAAQEELGIPLADETVFALMLSERKVIANRNIGKTQKPAGKASKLSFEDDDDDGIEEVEIEEVQNNPITLTADAAKNLSNDELKKYVTKYADKVVRTAAGKIDTVATRTALIGVTVL